MAAEPRVVMRDLQSQGGGGGVRRGRRELGAFVEAVAGSADIWT